MKRFKYLAVAAMVALGACDEGGDLTPSEPITGTLTVNVSAEGENVDVTVAIAGPESRSEATGADGTVSFADLEAGAYAVTISGIPSGFAFATTAQTATIDTEGETVTVSFSGSIVRTATIAGQVTAGGTGVAGVTIDIDGPEGGQSAQTGANGNYSFTGLRGGEYDITMNALANDQVECAEATVTRQLPAGGSAVADFGCTDVSAGDATISIQSITAGGAPINLNNVAGQIEVALNVDRAGNELDRAEVVIDGEVVATQSFGPGGEMVGEAGQAETVVLNVPTTQVREGANGYVPVVYNGGATVSANLFVVGAAQPVPSNEVPVVMNNPDAILVMGATVEPDDDADSADDLGGTTWFNQSANAGPYTYLSYAGPGFEPTSVVFDDVNNVCGAATSNLTGDAADGLVVTNVYACANAEGLVAPDYFGAFGGLAVTLPTTVGPDGSTVVAPTGISRLGAEFMLDGETRKFLIGNAGGITVPAALPIDNKAPSVSIDGELDTDAVPPLDTDVAVVAFNDNFEQWWVKGDYDFVANDVTSSDGGVGGVTERTFLWDSTNGCTDQTEITTPDGTGGGAVLAETVVSDGDPDGYRACAWASDALNNAQFSGASNWFGVDMTAPMARIFGDDGSDAIAPATAVTGDAASATPVSTTMDQTVYGSANMTGTGMFHYAGTRDVTMMHGLDAIDDRSGLDPLTGWPFRQIITHDGPNPQSCTAEETDMAGTVLTDNWRRVASPTDFLCSITMPGLFSYEGWAVDRAGNESQHFSFNWIVDEDNSSLPSVSNITPTMIQYTPGAAGDFNLFGSDDLEVVTAELGIQHPTAAGPLTLLYDDVPVADSRWDDTFVNILSPQVVTADPIYGRMDFANVDGTLPADFNTPVGDTDGDGTIEDDDLLPTGFLGRVLEDAGFNPQVGMDVTGSFIGFDFGGWSSSVAEPWNGADIITWEFAQPGGAGTTFVAEHTASTSIDAPFFDAVALVLNNTTDNEIIICAVNTAPVFSDNGINRFYTYNFPVPSGSDICGNPTTGWQWHAVGISGAALLVTAQNVVVP